ncbi:MAG: HlyC/CorC family transporter [Lachnospiraceae bacterium]|nr:HlyC/CorC family transporter [Lachnospiraceae bacterium]
MYSFGEASQNVNEGDLQERADGGDRKAKKLLDIVDKPKRFIVTIQFVTLALAMAVGFFTVKAYGQWAAEMINNKFSMDGNVVVAAAIYILVAFVIIGLQLAFGIIVPQRLGRSKPEKWSLRLMGIVNAIMIILKPFTAIISGIAYVILKLVGIDYRDDTENVTEEEIMSIVNEGHEQGILEEQEAEMISNIIEMDEKEAAEIMTHRKNIVAIDGDWTLAQTVEFIISENNSRFPVYEEDIDNIIGILHIRDVFSLYKKEGMEDKKVKELNDILREPKFIPETRNIDMVFRDMQKDKNHMDIIIDEYGQTAGIITMEDILEEIVGNIMDEYDEDEENIVKQSDDTYIIKGTTALSDIEDELDVTFNEEDYDTLNGYLINKLERIPSEDEKIVIETDEFKFEVLSIEGKMITLVKMTIIEKEDKSEDEEE